MKPNFKSHFELMAAYNQRLNNQVYEAAAQLNRQQLTEDAGAFFKSVQGTLNHILIGDLLWLTRFKNHPTHFPSLKLVDRFPAFESLDHCAYKEFSELSHARNGLDELIIQWIANDIHEQDFANLISYKDTKGNDYRKNFAALLAHLFNHQTHHRGQVSTLLNQFSLDIGITDLLIDIPSE